MAMKLRSLDVIEPRIEAALKRGREALADIATLLAEVREGKQYREAGYASFAMYCKQRWGRSDAWAIKAMKAAESFTPLRAESAPRSSDGRLENQDLAQLSSANRRATAEKPQVLSNVRKSSDAKRGAIEENDGPDAVVEADWEPSPDSEPAWLEMREKIDAAADLIDRTVRALLSEGDPGCEGLQTYRASIVQQCGALVRTLRDLAPVQDTPPGCKVPGAVKRGWITRHELEASK